ncbi:MAG TPA: AMP-binding protein [Candidatus Saccharimonadales bacterium]|jgi:long-chain acyl-CoA synthetase|nr:AMP-binding protein [Candidatus Saccharimonadales bacterium]
MLDLAKYQSIGAALKDALEQFAPEVCLIESDRDREKERLTYRDFKERAHPLAKALQNTGFKPNDRAAIIMTNQSKWLISAYAIFYAGGVLVPLDYKLTPEEQWQLLKHSSASVLITEYPIWRQLAVSSSRSSSTNLKTSVVTEAPANADVSGSCRWEEFRSNSEPAFIPRRRSDVATIVYSSGTGGRPKGCMMTHENYLEQCIALTSLYPFAPGVRYLSILPTNHAIDFMVGFFGPFICGAAVVHLRTLRPEYVREALPKYKITYVSLVPLVLKNLQKGLQARFDALPPRKRKIFNALVAVNRAFTKSQPRRALSRRLLKQVHDALGGELRAIIVGGAFTEPQTLQFFYDLGIPVANGYGLTEAGTAITVNDLKPFRADTVGKPLPGMEVRIVNPDAEGIGEVSVRSKTVMAGYLNEPELTAETVVDGWLMTGDLGRFDSTGHLQLFGRKKNMIVTEEGKNIYPEDIEAAFEGLLVKEFCIFAANYIWPQHSMVGEQLLLVLHLESGQTLTDELRIDISNRNHRLLNYKRVHGLVLFSEDFPRTASLKIKRNILAERLAHLDRVSAILPL